MGELIDIASWREEQIIKYITTSTDSIANMFIQNRHPFEASNFCVGLNGQYLKTKDLLLKEASGLWMFFFVDTVRDVEFGYYMKMAQHPEYWQVSKTLYRLKEESLHSHHDDGDSGSQPNSRRGDFEDPSKDN